MPRAVLAKNWSVPENALDSVYQVPLDGNYIFQAAVPSSLKEHQRAAAGKRGASPLDFNFSVRAVRPVTSNRSGEVRVVDSRSFKVSATIAAAQVTVRPGGLREVHWHQNAEEWQYYIVGKGRITVFFNGAKARTADFNAGDVGYIPKTFGHYIENLGNTDLVFLEMCRSDRYQDLSLSDWITHTRPDLVMAHLRISRETLDRIPKSTLALVPA